VSFKVRVRVRLGFGFGIGNLIGGAVGTVGSALARRLTYRRRYQKTARDLLRSSNNEPQMNA